MFDLFAFHDAMLAAIEAGTLVIEPEGAPKPSVWQYRCRRCDVAGRSESEDHTCWSCGGTDLETHRFTVRDQSMSNAAWAQGERVDRLIERSE